jgi:putative hydrolase of HD superfamily
MADERLSPELIEALVRLKEVPRTGWLDRGIPADVTESVADHSFGVALLAWLLAPDDLDRARVVELSLIHDLAEAAVGDATPYDRELLHTLDPDTRANWLNQRHVRSEEQRAAKYAAEDAAIRELAATVPEDMRERLLSRWAELRERSTPEATFVKQMDILETVLQSRRYRERYPDAPMESFELEAREALGW